MTSTAAIGFYGRLGSGNLGNDASFEALLAHVQHQQPDARLDARCFGPERVTARYGLPASHLQWLRAPRRPIWRPLARAISMVRILLGAVIDAVRTAWWVAAHDVVLVPGMGVFEATMVVRPWQEPYAMFLLAVCGRLFRTRVGMVGVGASPISQPLSRWLVVAAVRLATYVSYRDHYSRDAMRKMGARRLEDSVVPDLVFALAPDASPEGRPRTVAVGVMAYRGGSADAHLAQELHDTYLDRMTEFTLWLVDNNFEVCLIVGDHDDEVEAEAVLQDVLSRGGDRVASRVSFRPGTSTAELLDSILDAETVVATRFHNVLTALTHARPTLAIAYGGKHIALMDSMGMGGYAQNIRELDVTTMKAQFLSLQTDGQQIRRELRRRTAHQQHLVELALGEMTASLLDPQPAGRPAPTAA